MPFLTRSLNDERVLLFCRADERHLWKLHVSINDGEPIRIETCLAEDMVECSPSAWQDETGWHISFIAGGSSANPLYHLYRMDGSDFTSLSQPVVIRQARSGFIYLDRTAAGAVQDTVSIHDPEGDKTLELPGCYIYRVSYRADQTDSLLITGQWIGEEDVFTIEYNLITGEQQLLECDGTAAYKPAIYGDEILYAERTGTHFEERRIRRAERHHSKQCRLAVRRQRDDVPETLQRSGRCRCSPKTNQNEVSRPSCLECVEKHLGAAFVLSSEIHSGYAYRLRLIGHLHEAEDEAQEFQELFQTIRTARKNYQREGILPDWETIARIISNMKNTD